MAVCNPQVDANTNKLIGYQFDNAGNTKVDAANRQFIYDGENKQVEVKDQYGTSIGKYFFDGDGKRVKKISATETTVFVYNASGQLVAEYSTQISQTPQVSYLTTDHLGSPRINTDENGKVIARHDFQPFGEEIQRPSYGADDVRQKFTSYERDNETELDFAQARMHSYALGRFTSPDGFLNDTHPAAPQSWNLYVYVRNNPLKYIDPSGKEIWISFQEEEEYEEDGETRKRTVTRRVQYRSGALLNEDGSEYAGSNQYALNARDYLNALSQDPVLGTMIDQMDRSRRVHTIMRDTNDPDRNGVVPTSKARRSGTTIYWSGEDRHIHESVDGSSTLVGVMHKAIFVLAHEILGHARFVDQGRERNIWLQDLGVNARFVDCVTGRCLADDPFNQAEADAISVENRARRLLGGKEREFWGGLDVSELLTDGDFISPRKRPKIRR